MADVYPLIQMLIHLSAFIPQTPWETCAVNLVARNHPSSVYFFCKSSTSCPSNDLYKRTHAPTQITFETNTDNLPQFKKSDFVFLIVNEDGIVWSNKTIQKYRLGGKNDFKLVVVANMSENPQEDMVSMGDLFRAMWQSGLVYSAVLLKNDTSAAIFTYIPFRSSESCEDTSPVSLGECAGATGSVFDPLHKVVNVNNCPIRVTLQDDRPFLNYPLVGGYSDMILEMGHRMNFSVEPMKPADTRSSGSCGKEELEGVRGEVAVGRAHMTVGNFQKRECSQLEYIGPPYMQCMSWCTPIAPGNADVLDFLIREFRANVWIAIVVTVLFLVITVVSLSYLSQETLSSGDTMNLALALFAQVPHLRLRTDSIRTVVAIWLIACLVIRAAYEGESKSRNTVPIGSYIIHDLKDLPGTGLRLCSSPGNIGLFRNSEEPLVQWFYNNTKVCKPSFYEMIKAAREQHLAVFTSDLRCRVTSTFLSKEKASLYSYTGGCFKTAQVIAIITLPGSPFNERWKDFLLRFTEGGLIQKWLNVKALRRSDRRLQPFSLKHLLPSLLVLILGCGFAFIVFLIENAMGRYT